MTEGVPKAQEKGKEHLWLEVTLPYRQSIALTQFQDHFQ
jgi:hypothetical protein